MKNHIKLIIIGVLTFCTVSLSILVYDQYRTRKEVEATLTEALTAYSRLAGESQVKLDSIEVAKNLIIEEKNKNIVKYETLLNAERKRNKELQDKLDVIISTALQVTPDSSYSYINAVYPPISQRIYSLDTFQIKSFHQIDLEYKANKILTQSLYKTIGHSNTLISTLSNQTNEYKELYDVAVKKYDMALSNNRSLLIELGDVSAETMTQRRMYRRIITGMIAGIATGTVLILVN
jgi:hypothetical protein